MQQSSIENRCVFPTNRVDHRIHFSRIRLGRRSTFCFAMAHDYFFHRVVEMPANIPVSLDVQTAEVLDTRTAGSSNDTNSTGTTSDDRLKWDETPITNGLNVINQLQPQVYWKGKQLKVEPTQTERRRESGFIAQEVEQIPELAHTVSQSEDEERSGDTYYLDYTQIMAFQVAAIKELHKIVQEQNERLLALESSKMTV